MSVPQPRSAPFQQAERAIVFADACESTKLFERYGNDRAMRVIARVLTILSDETERHAGVVVKTIGDEIMATFAEAEAAARAATAMQQAVDGDAGLAEVGMRIKIGLHVGPVLLEASDVYGDAVNVAARMVGFAKPDQIITTRATVERLPAPLRGQTRSLGRAEVRGKEQRIELCELLWQPNRSALTNVMLPWDEARKQHEGRLVLHYGTQEFVVRADAPPFRMGRSPSNDLATHDKNASRSHAVIRFSHGRYVLTDRSTNGTYLRMGTEEVYLHRDQTPLLREGAISLGQTHATAGPNVIHFRCEG
jgi:class 3 adenylate cyclase